MATRKARSERIPEFESLRAFLAWWVVWEHVRNDYPLTIPSSLNNLIWAGHAVDVFILLSGFVIFLLLDSRHESYKAFIVRRIFRLWPVFLVCFLFALSMTGLGSGGNRLAILSSNLALLHGMVPESWCAHVTTTVLPPSWSISLEWQFYLVAPLLFLLMRRQPWVFFVALVGVVGLFQVLRDSKEFIYPSILPLRLHLFLLGALSYFIWIKAPPIRLAAKLPLALALVSLTFITTRNTALTIWSGVFGYVLLKRMDAGFVEPATGVAGHVTRWMGSISYSTYLCHWPVVLLLGKILRPAGLLTDSPLANHFIMLVAVVAVTLPLSWLLHITVEKPGMECGRRLARRSPQSDILINRLEPTRKV